MSITSVKTVRSGSATTVTVVSSLSGTIYYYWYVDGSFAGYTTSPSRSFYVSSVQSVIDVIDYNDPSFDYISNAPKGYPATRTIVWVRSISSSARTYRIEQKIGSGSWLSIGVVSVDITLWNYQFITPRLLDLTTYSWRVIPVDFFGNDGTPIEIDNEYIVRTPDAPSFSVSLNVSQKLVFSP